jgi:hypothetical protein
MNRASSNGPGATCEEFRKELLGADEPSEPPHPGERGLPRHSELARHPDQCIQCAAWALRLSARIDLIRSLPRLVAPRELSSLVVAAIQAGERQERAIRAVRGLGRLRGPRAMDDAVAAAARRASRDPLAELAGRRPAPDVLARLVSEELRDPAKARVARHVRSLPRLVAPAELEHRVHDEMTSAPRDSRATRRPRAFLTLLAAVAAGLLVAVIAPRLGSRTEYPFRVEHVTSIDSLDPTARRLVDLQTAGLARLELR